MNPISFGRNGVSSIWRSVAKRVNLESYRFSHLSDFSAQILMSGRAWHELENARMTAILLTRDH